MAENKKEAPKKPLQLRSVHKHGTLTEGEGHPAFRLGVIVEVPQDAISEGNWLDCQIKAGLIEEV